MISAIGRGILNLPARRIPRTGERGEAGARSDFSAEPAAEEAGSPAGSSHPVRPMPGHDSAFITQLAAHSLPQLGERRRNRNRASVFPLANSAYQRQIRLPTELEPGFLSDTAI